MGQDGSCEYYQGIGDWNKGLRGLEYAEAQSDIRSVLLHYSLL